MAQKKKELFFFQCLCNGCQDQENTATKTQSFWAVTTHKVGKCQIDLTLLLLLYIIDDITYGTQSVHKRTLQ